MEGYRRSYSSLHWPPMLIKQTDWRTPYIVAYRPRLPQTKRAVSIRYRFCSPKADFRVQNAPLSFSLSAGAPSVTRLGELRRLPNLLVDWGGWYPFPIPFLSTHSASRCPLRVLKIWWPGNLNIYSLDWLYELSRHPRIRGGTSRLQSIILSLARRRSQPDETLKTISRVIEVVARFLRPTAEPISSRWVYAANVLTGHRQIQLDED